MESAEARRAVAAAMSTASALPHQGNVLIAKNGPLFIDFENFAHGPVEYDLGWVPKEVSDGSW